MLRQFLKHLGRKEWEARSVAQQENNMDTSVADSVQLHNSGFGFLS